MLPESIGRTVFLGIFAMLGGCVSTGAGMNAGDGMAQRVSAGKPAVMKQAYMTFDRRCRSTRRPSATITQPPSHGSARTVIRNAAAIYGPGPYQQCNGKVAPALAFEYTSVPDYRGPDHFETRVRYADGELRTDSFAVDVR